MVPPCQAVQLLVREQMILQQTGRELGVWKTRADGDERDERCAQVVDAVLVVVLCALGSRRDGGDDCDVVFW